MLFVYYEMNFSVNAVRHTMYGLGGANTLLYDISLYRSLILIEVYAPSMSGIL